MKRLKMEAAIAIKNFPGVRLNIKAQPPPPPRREWDNVKFPCQGIADDGQVVLFFKNQVGVTIKAPSRGANMSTDYVFGYSDSWAMDCFVPAEKGSTTTFTAM